MWLNIILILSALALILISLVLFYYKISIKSIFKFIKLSFRNFPRDFRAFIYYIKVHYYVLKWKLLDKSVNKLFEEVVKKYANKTAIYYKEEKWTFKQLDEFSNQVAVCFLTLGYRPKNELALMMDNRPEFIGIWLGLSKIGITSALINTNNKNDTLIHSLNSLNCRAIIFDSKLTKSIADITSNLTESNSKLEFYSFGDIEDQELQKLISSRPIHNLIANSIKTLPINVYKPKFNDKLYYIFTSGTTGYPKAAIIPHHRYLWGGTTPRIVLRIQHNDIIYLPLPLYHGNAGTLGTSQALLHGSSIVLRDKFSAKEFLEDCVKYKCTVAIYIGEICRYLLAQPVGLNDKKHSIRVMFGNGLRPRIWRDFQQRFGIRLIGEFYGSTEGNANLSIVNFVGQEGSCGFYPYYYGFFVRYLYPVSLLKLNPITGEVLRDSNGLCISAKPGDVGELIGKIRDNDPISQFEGYVSKDDTKKKIIENVHKLGDKAFLTGDLMQMDENGFIQFKDRTGDTFRWKGENVSTAEVEAIIQKVTKLSDCVVIGLTVGQCEGKAGIAIISAEDNRLDLKQLAEDLKKELPSYAIPLFIRLTDKIDLTATYKLTKYKFIKFGFNPDLIEDKIYFLDKESNNYIPLDSKLYNDIMNSRIKI